MDRNFFRRIEVCFPLMDVALKKRVIDESLRAGLADNTQSWEMDGEGGYHRKKSERKQAFSSQLSLIELLSAKTGGTKS